MLSAPLILLGAWLLDQGLGEPRRYHPLNGFARLAGWLEGRLNRRGLAPAARRRAGLLAVVALVAPPVLATALLASAPLGWVAEGGLLYLCLGGRSLHEHARAVAGPLGRGDLAVARTAVSRVVGRDTRAMDAGEVARASVESTLENGNDAVFATLFWFLIGGAPAAVAHRLVNTLDALWGYRTERFAAFGRTAARLDDLLGWIPARLTAATYAVVSRRPQASWAAVRDQAGHWPGSNPGTVLAAGAGALGATLGGTATYAEGVRERPTLGAGAPAGTAHVERAAALVERGVWLWLALAAALGAVAAWGL
mgnify:CR=1 FL=1